MPGPLPQPVPGGPGVIIADYGSLTPGGSTFAASGSWNFGSLIIQWGTVSVAAASTAAVVYSVKFPNVTFQVVISSNKASASQVAGLSASGFTTTGFTAANQNATNADTGSWIAIGG